MQLPPGTIEAFGLTLVRVSALILAAPLLGTASTFSGYRIGLIGVLSAVLYVTMGWPALDPVTPVTFGVLAMREVLIGLTLAFTLHAVLLAVRVASELIGHEMAFTMSRQVDPATGVNMPLIAHIYELLFFLALLAMNGHQWIVRALFASTERAPVGVLRGSGSEIALPGLALTQFTELFAAGLTFAAPMLVMLMLVSVSIGLLTRAVPQINILEFGFSLRILGGLVAMLIFAPALEPALEALMGRLMQGLNASLDLMGA